MPGQHTRDAVEESLSSDQASTPMGVLRAAKARAEREGWQFHWRIAVEHWGELSRCGVIAFVGTSDVVHANEPLFVVTERGKRLLARGADGPQNTTRYMTALRQRVRNPDPIALSYIEEAIGTWKSGQYRATVVMAGCACERLVIMLADAISKNANLEPYTSKLKTMLSGSKPGWITGIFDQVKGALATAVGTKLATGDVADALDRRLTPIFEYARSLRNSAGHPTVEQISAEDAEAVLLLFPGFCDFATRWIEALQPTPPCPS